MGGSGELLDRAVPDRVDAGDLPRRLAAEVDHLAGRWRGWTDESVPPGLRARALVQAGEHRRARAVLGSTTAWEGDPQDVVAATWAASRVGPPDALLRLAPEVAALGGGFLVVEDVPLGPAAVSLGLVGLGTGDLDGAVDELREAVAEGDRRAPVWGARARLELARVLWSRAALAPDDPDADGEAARRAQTAAATFFAATGHRHLEEECEAMTAGVADGRARPFLGHLVPGGRWTVGFGVMPAVDVDPSKGLLALRRLLATPDRPVPVVELAQVADGEATGAGVIPATTTVPDADDDLRSTLFDDRARSRVTKLLRRTVAQLTRAHPLLGRHLDASLTTGYACRYSPRDHTTWTL